MLVTCSISGVVRCVTGHSVVVSLSAGDYLACDKPQTTPSRPVPLLIPQPLAAARLIPTQLSRNPVNLERVITGLRTPG